MYHNDKKYALTNCVLLDGSEHMEPQTGKAVCIAGEKISEIVDAQHIPAGYEAVDLGGKYVLPGLINMHVHLAGSGKIQKKQRDNEKLVRRILGNPVARGRVIDRPKAKRNARLDAGLDPLLA